jgi:ribosomal protein L22
MSPVTGARRPVLAFVITCLIVPGISVAQGPTARRFMPRAMGRATPIHKKTSHVHVVLSDEATKKKVKN